MILIPNFALSQIHLAKLLYFIYETSPVDMTLCVYVLGEWIHGGKRIESFPVFHNGLLLSQICFALCTANQKADNEVLNKAAK